MWIGRKSCKRIMYTLEKDLEFGFFLWVHNWQYLFVAGGNKESKISLDKQRCRDLAFEEDTLIILYQH